MLNPEELADWRVHAAGRVAADTVLPGGGTVKEGELFFVVTLTKDSREGIVSFATPGAAALHISIAIRAARDAVALRKCVHFDMQPGARIKTVSLDSLPTLYDYFEKCMIGAGSSYQALEAFANQIIANEVQGTYALTREDETVHWTAAQIERRVPTEEKLASILPDLCKVASPKGRRPWDRFKRLKDVRDSTVHLKSVDHYRTGDLDRGSLFHRLLNADPREYPRTVMLFMRHFALGQTESWISFAERSLEDSCPPEPRL